MRTIHLAMGGGFFDVHTNVDWSVYRVALWLAVVERQINRELIQFRWPDVKSVVMKSVAMKSKPGMVLSINTAG